MLLIFFYFIFLTCTVVFLVAFDNILQKRVHMEACLDLFNWGGPRGALTYVRVACGIWQYVNRPSVMT